MSWTMPTRAEQEAHLKKENIEKDSLVCYGAYGKTVWKVQLVYEIGPRFLCVLLKSESSGITRTAWPWELKRVF